MSAELIALAESAATALVQAATTDTWHAARDRVLRLFGRDGKREAERAERRLERTAAKLQGVEASELEQARIAQSAVWEESLSELLDEHPEFAEELRAFAADFAPAGTANTQINVARDHATQYIAFGDGASVNHNDHRGSAADA